MSEFRLDWDREERTGLAEAVLCTGKTPSQVAAILAAAGDRPLLLTRLEEVAFAALPEAARRALDYHPPSRTAFHGRPPLPAASGVAIVCAGTSDVKVVYEAERSLVFAGHMPTVIADVGVAGLWRLMERLEQIRDHRIVIAVAGMEGALFSVLAGLVAAPLIAVPTSVGYGVAEGGRVALASALASCAAGIVCVNIDNGYGAACAALRMLRHMPAIIPSGCPNPPA